MTWFALDRHPQNKKARMRGPLYLPRLANQDIALMAADNRLFCRETVFL
jgi:hypothetical protein